MRAPRTRSLVQVLCGRQGQAVQTHFPCLLQQARVPHIRALVQEWSRQVPRHQFACTRGPRTCRGYDKAVTTAICTACCSCFQKARSLLLRLRHTEHPTTWRPLGNQHLIRSTLMHTVIHSTFTMHGRDIERENPWEKSVLVRRLGLCSMNKDERSSQSVARKFLTTNSKQLEQNKIVKFYKKNYGVSKRNFVKIINKILLSWRNYENSRVLPSIRSPDRSS